MTSNQINFVLELAKTLNFNRAAENLFITQPSLTYNIKAIEEEIGFTIFRRSKNGVTLLTPAGKQFCVALKNIRDEFRRAIEKGQNISRRYKDNLTIGLPMRSAIYFLPQAIEQFEKTYAGISVTPEIVPLEHYEKFLCGELDIIFAREQDMRHVQNIKIHRLFKSKIYLITEKNDPLAQKEKVSVEDLQGKILMVGGGSQPELRAVQSRVIQELNLEHFNSNDRDTTLVNLAAHKGICLAPGFLNDHNGEFAWTPFDCEEKISCVVCTHSDSRNELVLKFVQILKKFYEENPNFPA